MDILKAMEFYSWFIGGTILMMSEKGRVEGTLRGARIGPSCVMLYLVPLGQASQQADEYSIPLAPTSGFLISSTSWQLRFGDILTVALNMPDTSA
jgi:hypothetical protein